MWYLMTKYGIDIVLSVLGFCLFLDTGIYQAFWFAVVIMLAFDLGSASERLAIKLNRKKVGGESSSLR